MSPVKVPFTYHHRRLLLKDESCELLDGDFAAVLRPNPLHQQVSRKLALALGRRVNTLRLGKVLHPPHEVILSEKTVVQPDVSFVRKSRLGIIECTNLIGAPDLIVEVLSHGSRQRDLVVKRKLYAAYGIKEYWIADPYARNIQVLVWSELGYINAGIWKTNIELSSPLMPELKLPLNSVFY
jgi:Uma2 family endonuclease